MTRQDKRDKTARRELLFIIVVMWMIFISIPIYLGHIGLSWDGLNHQIYLGWVADSPRFDKDYMAASLQSYQFPYLYWPLYKLADSGVSGSTAGVVLSTMHLVAVPPVWIIAKLMITGEKIIDIYLRLLAVILAFMSAVPLKTLEATGNDLLAAAPLLWTIALALKAVQMEDTTIKISATRLAILSGLIGGFAVACKLSNGPLVILVPGIFLYCRGQKIERAKWMAVNALGIGIGFFVTYSFWGYQLWMQFGNPVFPFFDTTFESLRQSMNWHP